MLAAEIRDRDVQAMFERFADSVAAFHPDIRVQTSRVEARFFFFDAFICRLVPHHELFRVQLGESPAWDTRIRTAGSYAAALDRTLENFLQLVANKANIPANGL